ncbi:hypothetical protein GCM10010260_84290 [Streptomyces filipinensis]|uniref:Helix-turn-helix domain-containing protein n=1 Tax=Streptomyces filipinensis TaxID=66887 RepID=A0A918IN38_9ACTN|nr:hypothetical protein [Streptomyces filipinensis]GGV31146.1 hypothetical protein GCM10010260_84290 [Streptomyces filipinensis]
MERPRLSLRAAADACGVSLSTMRRHRENGSFPGARRDPKAGWTVPVEDLLAAGFRLNAPGPTAAEEEQRQGVAEVPAGPGAAARVAELERDLLAERHRRELAEAEARSLGAQLAAKDENLADLRRAMLALTAGAQPAAELTAAPTVPAQAPPPATAPEAAAVEQGKRRWWPRRG